MPFILSHHPLCDKYSKGHYITVGKYSLCIGCTFTYPTIIILLLLNSAFNIMEIFLINPILIAIISIAFLAMYASGLFDKSIKAKILSKIYLGTIVTSIMLYVYYSITSSIVVRVYLTFLVLMVFLNTFSTLRGVKILWICRSCEQWDRFPFCDGFRDIVQRLIKDGFAECLKRA